MTKDAPHERYRDVTLADDGTVLGQRKLVGGSWLAFQADLDLLWIRVACESGGEADEAIWAQQDGYGRTGYTPPQGWDWSGIRDSSAGARAAMLATARAHVPAAVLATVIGVPAEVLTTIADANYAGPQ